MSDNEIFVNREDELEWLTEGLSRWLESGVVRPDDEGHTLNVSSLYGNVGYGKKALATQWQRKLAAEIQLEDGRFATAHLDFADGGQTFTFTTILGVLRNSVEKSSWRATMLRRLTRRLRYNFPAYDYAVRGMPLKENPSIGARREGDPLEQAGGDVVGKSTDVIVSKLKDAAPWWLHLLFVIGDFLAPPLWHGPRQWNVRRTCKPADDFFAALKEGKPEELSGRLPRILDWELERKRVKLVVSINGLETILHDEVGEPSSKGEVILRQLFDDMPNVFFVISGHHEVEWARSQRVGPLLKPHPDEYLKQRLVLSADGEPAIGHEVRKKITGNEHAGWPIFLEACTDLFRKTDDRSPSNFQNIDLSGLVERILVNLTPSQKRVVLCMSMLRTFTLELAREVADASLDDATELTGRFFLRKADSGSVWTHHMDPTVRDLIEKRRSDGTPPEMGEMARHAIRSLGSLFSQAREQVRGGPVNDYHAINDYRAKVIAYLTESIRIAAEYRISLRTESDAEWIPRAAYEYVRDYVWEDALMPLEKLLERHDPATSDAVAFGLALCVIQARQRELSSNANSRREQTRSRLADLFEPLNRDRRDTDDTKARDLVQYFLAEATRDTAETEEEAKRAEMLMKDLVDRNTFMRHQALEGLIYDARRRGDFVEAQLMLEDFKEEDPAEKVTKLRVWADTLWSNGLFDKAVEKYDEATKIADDNRLKGHAAEAQASLAYCASFGPTDVAKPIVERARKRCENVNNTWSRLQVDNANLLLKAGRDGTRLVVESETKSAKEEGLSSSAVYAAFACAFDAEVGQNDEALAAACAQIREIGGDSQFRWLVEIVEFWRGSSCAPSGRQSDIKWLDGMEKTAERWRAIVEKRKEEMGRAR